LMAILAITQKGSLHRQMLAKWPEVPVKHQ
jgi:hypothetical protein